MSNWTRSTQEDDHRDTPDASSWTVGSVHFMTLANSV